MLNDIRIAVFRLRPENSDFCVKREALTVSTLRRHSFVKKAERALSPCNKALTHCNGGLVAPRNGRTGLQGGPYGKLTMPKTYVKKAETASRLFYFTEKEMQKIKN